MPYSILKKVYDRGMATGGHRPVQLNSNGAFAVSTHSLQNPPGTWGGDKDLAKQVRGSK